MFDDSAVHINEAECHGLSSTNDSYFYDPYGFFSNKFGFLPHLSNHSGSPRLRNVSKL